MFIHVYMCAHVRVCMCSCICAWGTPPNTLTESHLHPPTPTPQGVDPWNQSKVNENLTNRDISILFEDFGSLVHSYWLHLVCRWGSVLSQIALFTFRPKNVHILLLLWAQFKNFPVFTLESDRPYWIDNQYDFWPPNPFMTLSNSTWNEDQRAKLN